MASGSANLNGSGPSQVYMSVSRVSQSQSGNYTTYRVIVKYLANGSGSFIYDGNTWSAAAGSWSASGSWQISSGYTDYTLVDTTFNRAHNSDGIASSFTAFATINTNHSGIGDGTVNLTEAAAPRIPKAPDAPTMIGVDTPSATSLRVRFSAPADNGGNAINNYTLQRATNSSFSGAVSTTVTSGTNTISGLANHTQYWFRVRANNDIGSGPYSSSASDSTLGHPTAPLNLSAAASTSVTGRVALTWDAPATIGEGGITGYVIYRDGTKIATTTGTGRTYTDDGRTPYTTYEYTVAARNAYSDSVSAAGPQSAADSVVASGPPGAPTNLTATPDGAVPGRVALSWTAPTNTGTGGITGYKIYFAGGSLIANQNGTDTTYTVNGLTPGTTYSFQVFARNALSDAEGTMSAGSNTPTATPLGEPNAPTGLSATASTVVANRINLSWTAPAGTLSGYSIFERVGSVDTLIRKIGSNHTSYQVDGLTAGTARSYVVRARTAYTDTLSDGYPGNWGGAASAVATATPSNNSDQTVPSLAVATSGTNAVFAGTQVISAVTSNTISFPKVSANIAFTSSGGSISNSTNAIFNGTYTITAAPTNTKFSYAKTNSNIPLLGALLGTVTNNTNTSLNATNVTVTAVNSGAHTVAYTKSGADLATVAVPVNTTGNKGLVTNLTNASFNVTGKIITAATDTTLSYAQTGSNVVENNAAGTVTDTTNKNLLNGIFDVVSVPAHNSITYTVASNTEAAGTRTWAEPTGDIFRWDRISKLGIRYRSGWIG